MGKYKLYNQNDYASVPYPNSGNKNANIKTSGCGVVSMAMILNNLMGINISVATMAQYSLEHGARASAGTNMKTLAKAVSKDYPEMSCTTTNDEGVLKEHLQGSGMAIMNADGNDGVKGIFAYAGHYLAILGIKDGKPLIADPAWTSSRYKTTYRKQYVTDLSNIQKGLITCDWYVLDMDTKYRSPNYYLFKNIAKKEEEDEMTYKDITEVPEWGKEAVQRRIDANYTDGTNLTESMVRIWVIADRENPIYNDLKDVPTYWSEAVTEMVSAGIISGDGVHQVAMTRSELKSAIIAYRIHKS